MIVEHGSVDDAAEKPGAQKEEVDGHVGQDRGKQFRDEAVVGIGSGHRVCKGPA